MKREEFLKEIGEYSNHRILLWEALQLTDGDVVEFGSGEGSTPYLRKYCQENNRFFFSFENNEDWAILTRSNLIKDWDELNYQKIDILFIDHAPGERRKVDLIKYKDIAKIIVIHDSEPKGWNGSDYGVRELFTEFKYKADVMPLHPEGAWATILSNSIDVTSCIGNTFESHEIIKFQE